MEIRTRFLLILFGLMAVVSGAASAQESEKYTLTPAPDLWYNDVDGIRVGIRFLGEMEGSFKDGPHRLDLGVWLGTWFPEQPLSYYLSFLEPIPAFGDYGNEASIEMISSVRTGYSNHSLFFNKRWQPNFNEFNYTELQFGGSYDRMFEADYRAYPQLWTSEERYLLKLGLLKSVQTDLARTLISAEAHYQLNSESPSSAVQLEILQLVELSDKFKLRTRFFGGFAGEDVAPQNAYMLSMDTPVNWLGNGISRAKGTIPQNWLEAGNFQVGGGANLRGYLSNDIEALNAGLIPIYKQLISINVEIEYPNPLDNAINKISVVGDLIELRSYLFADATKGMAHPLNTFPELDFLADAGLGFQLSANIPDYLAKDRAVFIRYDLPLILKDATQTNVKFRQLIGLGAIFSF